MIARALALAAFLMVAAVASAGIALVVANQRLNRPFLDRGFDHRGPFTVVLDSGQSASEILVQLEEQGVLESAWLTRLYLVHRLDDPPLRAGEYEFDQPSSAIEVLDRIIRGKVTTYPLTVIEGLAYFEIAELIAGQGFATEAELRRLMEQPSLIADLDPEATTLEGYLFPETYHFAKGVSAEKIVETLVTTFRTNWHALAGDDHEPRERSVRDLVTLASIVEKEAVLDEERPLIAGVYDNRLKRPMTLGADPTLIYGLKLDGTWDGNLRRRDLRTDSPYNSYMRTGLPPSPICSPGLASLRSALDPAQTEFLYFVSRNDGSHVFARTLREHNRNVEQWQKAYWREKWASERRAR